MNGAIRENHNQLVRPTDTVYFLGDLILCGSWIDIKSNFNGHFQYIWGNHDRKVFSDGTRPPYGMCIKHFSKKVYLTHFPKNLPKGFDVYFTAHHHDHYKFAIVEGIKVMNVGVDVWNFRPISMKHAIKEYFNKNNWLGVQNIS